MTTAKKLIFIFSIRIAASASSFDSTSHDPIESVHSLFFWNRKLRKLFWLNHSFPQPRPKQQQLLSVAILNTEHVRQRKKTRVNVSLNHSSKLWRQEAASISVRFVLFDVFRCRHNENSEVSKAMKRYIFGWEKLPQEFLVDAIDIKLFSKMTLSSSLMPVIARIPNRKYKVTLSSRFMASSLYTLA